MRNILYKREIPINETIRIQIPTVGEILEHEAEYYDVVCMLTAMPADQDMMVALDDIGVDFSAVDEYDLFLLLSESLKHKDVSLVLGDLDFAQLQTAVNRQNGTLALVDADGQVVIDRVIYGKIAETLRKIHHLEKNRRKPGNEEARQYMIERARKKLKRRRGKEPTSQLEELIVALVNTEQFHYGFEGVLPLSIYQFNESVRQVIKKIDYDNRMHGIYAGTVNAKDLSQEDLNWMIHK